jgi:Ca2+-binding RTX toxin-like protein
MRAGARLAILAGTLATLAAPSVAQATVTCSVSGGFLQISSPRYGETMRVGRAGDQITVVGYDHVDQPFVPSGEPVPKTCAGPTPTVTTIDTIAVAGTPEDGSKLIMDLTGGLLTPGAAPEADGSPEIELTLTDVYEVVVRGSEGSDQLAFGVAGSSSAANLNAAEPSPDVDLTASPNRDGKRFHGATFEVAAGGGDDVISLAGGAAFTGPATYDSGATGQDGNDRITGSDRGAALVGGAGDDHIVGGAKPDFLGGGKGDGRDTLIAGGGNDLVFGQGGRDLILGGPGSDLIASGRGRDRVRCGPQRDALEVTTGRKDRRKGCEFLAEFNFS